jgi:hypothetical protein
MKRLDKPTRWLRSAWQKKAFCQEARDMKSLKFDIREYVAEGEAFEAWMMAVQSHYMEARSDLTSDSS